MPPCGAGPEVVYPVTYGRGLPLAHPIKGMTRAKLLEIAMDQRESQRLCVCAQDMEDIGFTYFPCTFGRTQEPLHCSTSNTVALMGFKVSRISP
jgi:hypothetical protein